MIPLKNVLFSSLFVNYDYKKHLAEDLEGRNQKEEKDSPLINLRYINYETFHDKLNKQRQEIKNIKRDIKEHQFIKNKDN